MGRTLRPVRRQAIIVSAAALLSGMALVASGCGSGGGSAAATSKTQTSGGPTPGLGLTAKNCRQLIDLPVTFTNAVTGLASNLDTIVVVLRQFARTAPFEIRPDFKVLAAAGGKITSTLRGVDLTQALSATPIAKLRKLSNEIDTGKVTDSSANISAWAQKNCSGGR